MPDLARLRRLSQLMQTTILVFGGICAAAVIWVFLESLSSNASFETLVREGLSIREPVTLTSASVGITAILAGIQFGLLFAALYCVWRMFGAFAGEEPLSLEPAIWMRRASIAFVLVAAGAIVGRTLIILALTMGNPPGQKTLAIGIGSNDLLMLLIALIMYMMGRVMVVAAAVRNDQRGFV
ncbi:DUF2975 domain-containing protein [Nitratireductor sp. ZSWI3]|uniref:DUF2975 domain-containing protein n=1 Tax=Nitratireductor sp. ZSWI3 TaxID=2966359 RepID=UPI00214F69B7|nr:DUF2975 domain-containing protein [Nitratireductor sp. ZSWI3]MCR4268136.1 DUF2975 domain-containing protein [Nitratireductor sp. ZSWI3]